MSSFESFDMLEPAANSRDRTRYMTDGRRLLEIVSVTYNYGLTGGVLATLADARDGEIVAVDVDALSMLTLEEVPPRAVEPEV